MITIIGPLGPNEQDREYKVGEGIELLGLSATVGGPGMGLCFDGKMKVPLWLEVKDIIRDLIKDSSKELEGSKGPADKAAVNIQRLEDELKQVPDGDFVAEVFALVDHSDSWTRFDILDSQYDIFFGVPYGEDIQTYNSSVHIQLAKPRDVIQQLQTVGREAMTHGMFLLGIQRGEDGTGYREDWKPLEDIPESRPRVPKRKRHASE